MGMGSPLKRKRAEPKKTSFSIFKRLTFHFTLVKEALIEIGCVVTSLVVNWLVVGWLVVTRVHYGQTVHPRPIVTMEH